MKPLMRGWIAAATSVAAIIPGGPAVADPGELTHVDDVSAVVGASSIEVSGTATFVDVPVEISQDPSGDAPVAGVGLDVTTATFSRPNPASTTLRLEIGVADATPTVFGAPTTLYHYPLTVNGEISSCGGGTGYWFPEARIASANPPSASPSFRLMCDLSPGAVATGPNITGSIEPGKVTLQFSMNQMGIAPGDTLGHGGDCVDPGTTTSPPGASWICNNATGDAAFLEDYVIPDAVVGLGIAPAGTPIDAVTLITEASVDASTGAFTGALPVPTEPGEYVAVAEACYGMGNCGRLATAAFTIA